MYITIQPCRQPPPDPPTVLFTAELRSDSKSRKLARTAANRGRQRRTGLSGRRARASPPPGVRVKSPAAARRRLRSASPGRQGADEDAMDVDDAEPLDGAEPPPPVPRNPLSGQARPWAPTAAATHTRTHARARARTHTHTHTHTHDIHHI